MKPLLTALLMMIFCACFSQKSDSLMFAKMSKRIISLADNPVNAVQNLPFSKIEILDARADTSSFGFIKNGVSFSKLVFNKSFADYYSEYVNKNYHLNKSDDYC